MNSYHVIRVHVEVLSTAE